MRLFFNLRSGPRNDFFRATGFSSVNPVCNLNVQNAIGETVV
jgi:hypothetical protein